jgi:hypothetical protein
MCPPWYLNGLTDYIHILHSKVSPSQIGSVWNWTFHLQRISIYGSTALVNLGRVFGFLICTHTVVRTPWTGDQPVARPLPTQDNKQNKCTHTHPCLEWHSNPRSQRSSGVRRFMPWRTRSLWSAAPKNSNPSSREQYKKWRVCGKAAVVTDYTHNWWRTYT